MLSDRTNRPIKREYGEPFRPDRILIGLIGLIETLQLNIHNPMNRKFLSGFTRFFVARECGSGTFTERGATFRPTDSFHKGESR